jgi:hypothetical protein
MLCHSLLPQKADENVAGLARQWWPEAKIWLLRSNFVRGGNEEILCDAVIPADPAGMLRETLALLRGLPNRPAEELPPPRAVPVGG